MKFTIPGKDVIKVNEKDFKSNTIIKSKEKIHLIKFDFDDPTNDKIEWVLDSYDDTNRFIVHNNIKVYNSYLKKTNKKYYIENNETDQLISFFKKNNKVLLNFLKLHKHVIDFIAEFCFEDVLYNTEVIYIDEIIYNHKKDIIDAWKGNVIIKNDYDL